MCMRGVCVCTAYADLIKAEYIYTSRGSPLLQDAISHDWKQMTLGSNFSPFTACQSSQCASRNLPARVVISKLNQHSFSVVSASKCKRIMLTH